MRNLKRALSLALASVMVASMTLIGAGAVSVDDFSDSADIVNKEAVTVLATLGVITGNDDGSYAPADTISRAEMSTIICRVLNGGKDPVLGEAVTNTYTDTASHWAKNYIEYCTTLGIIAGKGDGTFDPEGDVTVSEAAKMVLVALGYNAAMEGYTGGAWQINVDARANPLGLYDGLDYTTTNAPLTRDNAAQMLYNALDCDMVKYDVVLDTTSSTVISTTQLGETGETLLEDKFDAVKVEGIVVANEVANLETSGHLDNERTRILVTNFADQGYYGNKNYNENVNFAVSTGLDELGRAVSVYVKKNPTSTRAQVLGSVIVTEENNVVTSYSGDPLEDIADDNNMDIGNDTQIAYNYGNATDVIPTGDRTTGVEKIFIDNDDDSEVDYILENTYRFGKVTSYVASGDGSITVNYTEDTFAMDDKDDVVGFDDVARDDYVIAIEIGGRLYVEAAESVTGNLDAYKTSKTSGKTTGLTVDGEDYTVSQVAGYENGSDVIEAARDVGETYVDVESTFYLTAGGYVAAVGESEENAYNFALVLATGTTGLEDRVRVALSDGTIATYDFVTTGNAVDDPQIGTVYRYTLNSSGDIRLMDASNDPSGDVTDETITDGTSTGFQKGKSAIDTDTAAGADYYATANTAFFYVGLTQPQWSVLGTPGVGGIINTIDSDDVDVFAGYTNAPDLEFPTGVTTLYAKVYARDENTDRVGAVVFYGDANLAANSLDNVLYIAEVGSRNASVTNVTAFIANSGSYEPQAIQLDGAYTAAQVEGKTYTFTINPDGTYAISDTEFDGTNRVDFTPNGRPVTISNPTSFVVGGTEYEITDDTLVVDDSYYLNAAEASLGRVPNDNDLINYVVFNSSREAILVVIANQEEGSAAPSFTTNTTAGTPSNENGGVVASVEATGTGTLTYQWFWSTDNGATYSEVETSDGFTGVDTPTLSANASTLTNGNTNYWFYCRVTNTESGKPATSVNSTAINVPVSAPTQDNVLDNYSTAAEINAELVAAAANNVPVVTLSGNAAPNARIDIPDGVTLRVTGNFTDTAGVRTEGDGKLVVDGTYTNSGTATQINNVEANAVTLAAATTVAGTLNTGAITGAFALTVNAGATLEADSVADALTTSGTTTVGTVSGTLAVNAGTTTVTGELGTITVANGATLTVANTITDSDNNLNLTAAAGSTINMPDGSVLGESGDVSSDADVVITSPSGTLTYTTSGNVTIHSNYSFSASNSFVLNGTVIGAEEGVTITTGGTAPTGTAVSATQNFYSAAGNESTAGTKEALQTDATYVWATVYTDNAGTADMGWVRRV